MVLLSLVAPPLAPLPVYPLGPPEPVLVCCHCKRRVTEHRFECDSHPISSFYCRHCGDTLAIPSAVVNRSDADD